MALIDIDAYVRLHSMVSASETETVNIIADSMCN